MVGEQKLLVIAVGSLLISIAILVGYSLFKGSAVTTNREQLVTNLMALASKAQVHYKKPAFMAGGEGSFNNFQLSPGDTGNANGSYSCSNKKPKNSKYVPGNTNPIQHSAKKIYIVGCGKEIGTNHRDVVKVYIIVTQDAFETKILN